MKTNFFKFLIKYHIIKNGYLNPLILWGFLILTPPTMYVFNKDSVAEKSGYLNDQELLALILKEYGDENDLLTVDEPQTKITPKKSEIFAPKRNVTEEQDEQNNLFNLIVKARTKKNTLTKWDHFRLKVYQIALNIKKTYPDIGATPEQLYDWSMKTFNQESGFDGNAANPHSSARGLFQAMANVRAKLKMPVGLPLLQQVDYYEKYIYLNIDGQRLSVSRINSALDWYLIVFYPNLSDKSDNTVFAKCGGYNKKYCVKPRGWKHCNYHANCLYDLNKDGTIFKYEIGNHLLQKY